MKKLTIIFIALAVILPVCALGGFIAPNITGSLERIVNLNNESTVYATTTLQMRDSGPTYLLSGTGTTITLPAVTNQGARFRFVANGALGTGNVAITSAEGDNIEGSVIVAGAVVNCDAADVLTFVVDGENIGDFIDIMSTGTYWVPLQTGALTGSKLTCSG